MNPASGGNVPPVNELVRFALVAFFPREGDLPGLAELGVDERIAELRRDSTGLFWLGIVAAAVVFQISPILTVYRPWPAVFLTEEQLDAHAHKLATHPFYLLRQLIVLLKLMGGVFWGQSPEVRAFLHLPAYPDDPGTRRTEALVARPVAGPARAGRAARAARPQGGRARARRHHEAVPRAEGEALMGAGKHVSFESFSQPPLDVDVDFVVVGSGAGGAAAAVVLARGGHRVAIVEAGPWRAPEDYPSTTYGAMRDLFADWGSLVTQSRALWPVVQASCVGGTTVINSAIVVRTPADCFDRWEREYGIDGDDPPHARLAAPGSPGARALRRRRCRPTRAGSSTPWPWTPPRRSAGTRTTWSATPRTARAPGSASRAAARCASRAPTSTTCPRCWSAAATCSPAPLLRGCSSRGRAPPG